MNWSVPGEMLLMLGRVLRVVMTSAELNCACSSCCFGEQHVFAKTKGICYSGSSLLTSALGGLEKAEGAKPGTVHTHVRI